jgi:hypothetical protein
MTNVSLPYYSDPSFDSNDTTSCVLFGFGFGYIAVRDECGCRGKREILCCTESYCCDGESEPWPPVARIGSKCSLSCLLNLQQPTTFFLKDFSRTTRIPSSTVRKASHKPTNNCFYMIRTIASAKKVTVCTSAQYSRQALNTAYMSENA